MADIKQIQVGGTNYNIAGAAIILEDNGTTQEGVWKAKTDQITSLVDGQMFLYKTKIDTSYTVSQTTLTITANGTSLGSKNVYLESRGNFSCNANYYLLLIYFGNKFNIINMPYTSPCTMCDSDYNWTTKAGIEFDVVSEGLYAYYGTGQKILTAFTHQPDVSKNALTMFKASNKAKLMIHYSDATPDMEFINDAEDLQMRIVGSKIYAPNHLELCGSSWHDRIQIDDNETKIYGNYGSHAKFNFGAGTTLTLFDENADETLILDSNKVIGKSSVLLQTLASNSPKIFIDCANGTKIFMPNADSYTATPELALANYSQGVGVYTNRPIYLGNPNEDASWASTSIRYNSTDDSIDFVFD